MIKVSRRCGFMAGYFDGRLRVACTGEVARTRLETHRLAVYKFDARWLSDRFQRSKVGG